MKIFRKNAQWFFFFFSALLVILSPCLSQARLISSDTLLNQSNQMDKQIVQFRGEVIGDIMHRGNFCWINVNDGPQALGIYCPESLTKSIQFVGDYKHDGDIIEVSGVFHKACPEHGGELDIHAESLRIIQTGIKRNHPFAISKLYLATSLFFCTILMLGLYVYRKRAKVKPH